MAARLSPRDRPPLSAHQTAQDAFATHLWREAGMAIGRWLEQLGLEQRGRLAEPIASLTVQELEGMAWAAVARYQDIREERRRLLVDQSQASGDPLKPDPFPSFI